MYSLLIFIFIILVLCPKIFSEEESEEDNILKLEAELDHYPGSVDEIKVVFCEILEEFETVYHDYPNNKAIFETSDFYGENSMRIIIFDYRVAEDNLWLSFETMLDSQLRKFINIGALYIWKNDLLLEIYSLKGTNKIYYYVRIKSEYLYGQARRHFLQQYHLSDKIGDFYDDNTFFDTKIRDQIRSGTRIVFVSTIKTNYFFFVSQDEWHFYYHNEEMRHTSYCEQFRLDATKFNILGSFFIGMAQFLYVIDYDNDHAVGWLIQSDSKELCPLRFATGYSIVLKQYFCKVPQGEWSDLLWNFIIKWSTVLFLFVFNFLLIYYSNRNSYYMRRGWQIPAQVHKSKPGLVSLPTNTPMSDLASRYLVRKHGKPYRDLKRQEEDERIIIQEMKRLAKEILSENVQK